MSFGQAHLELHPVPRLAVIERPLIATGDGMCAGLEVKIAHCAHWFNDVDDGGETEAAGAATTPCLISVLGISASSGRMRRCRVLPFWRRETSRDCAIWISLGGRQKLTNCTSSCENELVGFMSRRNERTSSEEKPADCVALPVSPRAEGSTDASKTLEAMLPLVYDELRLLAGGYLRNERPEHTLQRTALVHEAYLRLAAQRDVSWENPAHFIAIFARLMRQTLTNHAVARTRAKRGGSDPTDLILEFYDRHQIDVTAVDEALRELEALDARQAQIVELRFFGGLRIEEIAKLLEISPRTVKREWVVAKLWLRQTLSQGE